MIKRIINKIKENIKREQTRRYYEVRGEWIKFFETRQRHLGKVELPAFILADQQMEIIKAAGEINHYYKMIMAYRRKKIAA